MAPLPGCGEDHGEKEEKGEKNAEEKEKKRKKKKEAAAAEEEVGDVEVDGETESMAAGNYLSSLCGSR